MKKTIGKIFLWRYIENYRNYPGYHITADGQGCSFLIDILTTFESTFDERQVKIMLSPVSKIILSVPNNTSGNPYCLSYNSLNIVVRPNLKKSHMIFSENNKDCLLEISKAQAGCIATGIADIQKGKGDYCIGEKKNQELWFWWYIGV